MFKVFHLIYVIFEPTRQLGYYASKAARRETRERNVKLGGYVGTPILNVVA